MKLSIFALLFCVPFSYVYAESGEMKVTHTELSSPQFPIINEKSKCTWDSTHSDKSTTFHMYAGVEQDANPMTFIIGEGFFVRVQARAMPLTEGWETTNPPDGDCDEKIAYRDGRLISTQKCSDEGIVTDEVTVEAVVDAALTKVQSMKMKWRRYDDDTKQMKDYELVECEPQIM
jgi:hypothetical protein